MIRYFAIAAALAFAGQAEAQNQRHKWQRAAVGTQPIELVFATHIDMDCKSKGESRLVISQAPKNGLLTGSQHQGFSEFSGSYAKCEDRKVDGLRVVYAASPGFKGKDRFTFIVVYSDGETRRYDVEMTVY
ncbi:MAG: hypothetical protein J0L51_01295 [Rhizobiales bacterium]|nr:hypothetical protein [Hyphomicrobiales bacterium]